MLTKLACLTDLLTDECPIVCLCILLRWYFGSRYN